MNVAVILAGGVGSRFGANIPKQYMEVKGKPIIAYTLEKFEDSSEVDAIEVVCADEWFDYVTELGRKYGISKLRWINQGGATCQDSIRNGVFLIRKELSDEDILMLHMSVSPMISDETIRKGFEMAKEKGNAFAVQSCLFCMCKKTTDEWSTENAYKEEYAQLNMPWVMNYGEIFDLYTDALNKNIGGNLNDYLPSLMFAYGKKVYFYPDNDSNKLKITTRGDLDLFEAYLILDEQKKYQNTEK